MKYIDLSENDCIDICNRVQVETGLSHQIIEKDWWVTTALRAMFNLPYAENLSFKGGTSLSKCWSLIERFSEDIDIAINREFLGFGGVLSKTQISDKLRRSTCSFVREKLQNDIKKSLIKNGVNASKFRVNVNITSITTTDPEIIEIEYQSLFQTLPYIKNRVIIEVSGRSMDEPTMQIQVGSMIDKVYINAPFTEESFNVKTVLVERTFLEKICLLHEEFSKPRDLIRTERMSRHLYDIVQIMNSKYADNALKDEALYNSVVEHRRKFIGLKGFDYETLYPKNINIIPPHSVINDWKEDYRRMQETMIYGNSLPFDELLQLIKTLNKRINQLPFQSK